MEPPASDTPASGAENTETIRGRGSMIKDRGEWANKTEFRLAMAGAIIGLGNMWRFTVMAYANGGGAFLLPYFVSLLFCGMPVFFLETALGQYTGEGAFTAWRKICPMFQGIGIASQVIVIYQSICGVVSLAWTLFYLYSSFKTPLPWSECDNVWNTAICRNQSNTIHDWSFLYNNSGSYYDDSTWPMASTPEDEFWNIRVLRKMDDQGLAAGLGRMQWELALCLLLAWVACYFCIWKGVKYFGKVVYFTVAFPFFLLIILFIRGVTLPGAWTGIMYYMFPDLSLIGYGHVWYNAVTEVLYSYAICQGVLTTLSSYNRYKYDCYKDCLWLCALNSVSNIFAGFVASALLGFGAYSIGLSVGNLFEFGPAMIFTSFPKVFSLLPVPQLWSIIFFLMMFFVGLDSQFLYVASLVTTISDVFPNTLRKPGRHEVLVLIIVLICFLFGLLLVTEGGFNVFTMIRMQGISGAGLMCIACFETITIGWIYGADRFYDNIEDMIGYQPFPVIKYCWLFVTPLFCVVLIIYRLAIHWIHPGLWISKTGALLILAPILCIPVFVLVPISKDQLDFTTPASDLKQARPYKPRLSLCKRVILGGRKPDSKQADEEKPAAESTSGV